jgi:hypothetical protein
MNKASPSRVVELNLLPRSERPGEVSPLALVFAAAIIVAIAALVPLSLQARTARSDADAMQARAEAAENGLHDVQLDLARQRALRAEIDQSKADLDAVTTVREQMQGGTRPLHEDFIWLYGLGFLTSGMKITAVTGTASGFRVDGAAPGPLDAIAYAEKLTSEGGFPDARVSAFTPAAKNGGQFTVEVTR